MAKVSGKVDSVGTDLLAPADVPVVNAGVPAVAQSTADSTFLALRPDSDLSEVLEANYAPGETFRLSDLIRVKVPSGGATQWAVEELDGEKYYPELTGIVVYYKPSGALWPSEEQSEGCRPYLVTRDLKVAEQFGEDSGDLNPEAIEQCRLKDAEGNPLSSPEGRALYDWQKLPYNQFGTAKGGAGRGKRCKESRLMCLLREGDFFPLFLRVPAGSLTSVGSFFRKLTVPHYGCVLSFTLTKEKSSEGIAFAQIKPKLVKVLTPAERAAVKTLYTERLEAAMHAAAVEAEPLPEDDGNETF